MADELLTAQGKQEINEMLSLFRKYNISFVSHSSWLDDEQKAEAARLKLYNMGMSATEVHKVVPALDKWFDRTQGKAPQSIALDVKDNRLDKMPIDRLLRLASMLDDPIIIAPMPQKLGDADQ